MRSEGSSANITAEARQSSHSKSIRSSSLLRADRLASSSDKAYTEAAIEGPNTQATDGMEGSSSFIGLGRPVQSSYS
jgi:hypothetical protein